ncbi:hypothetical protein [Metallibacterium sp.]
MKLPIIDTPIWFKITMVAILVLLAFFKVRSNNADVFVIGSLLAIASLNLEQSLRSKKAKLLNQHKTDN